MSADRIVQCYATRASLRHTCASPRNDWLRPSERRELARYTDPLRREAWLMGRLLGKQMITRVVSEIEAPSRIKIRTRDDHGRHVRPQVSIDGRQAPWSLSISHSDSGVLAALSLDPLVRVGVDLAAIGPRSAGFLRLWFTEAEQELLRRADSRETARFWAAKEAVYKAVNDGETFAPRRFDIACLSHARSRLVCRTAATAPDGRLTIETRDFGHEVGATAVWRNPMQIEETHK